MVIRNFEKVLKNILKILKIIILIIEKRLFPYALYTEIIMLFPRLRQ